MRTNCAGNARLIRKLLTILHEFIVDKEVFMNHGGFNNVRPCEYLIYLTFNVIFDIFSAMFSFSVILTWNIVEP